MRPYILIKTQQELSDVCLQLSSETSLSVDTEFDHNSFTYGLNLCLVQVCGPKGPVYLIDPFEDYSLTSLYKVMEDPTIEKVIHSAGEDLLVFQKEGCFPKNVFDTEKAARMVGEERSGLSDLVQTHLGIELTKSHQRTDWNQRPLKEELLEYAASDVMYLQKLKVALGKKVDEKGIREWVDMVMEPFSRVRLYEEPDPLQNMRIPREFDEKPALVFSALFRVRERWARKANKPPYRILGNDVLKFLAQNFPENLGEWSKSKGLSPQAKKLSFYDEVVREIEKGRPKTNGLNERTPKALFQKRKQVLNQIQKELNLVAGEAVSRHILSNSRLGEIASTGSLEKLPGPMAKKVLEKVNSLGWKDRDLFSN